MLFCKTISTAGEAMLKDRTKELFASGLERMMETMPLSKVRVDELCTICGTGRQTFYYHFHDKYDLVAWIFERDYRLAQLTVGNDDFVLVVSDALRRMWEKREFYRKAFADKSQNSISEYIQDFDVRLMTQTVCDYLGIDTLSGWQVFAIKHLSYGSIGCTLEWLQGLLIASPEELAQWEFDSMPPFLKEAYQASVAHS